jgi:hypothetical protein
MRSVLSRWLLIVMTMTTFLGCEVEGEQFKHAQLTSNRTVIYVYRPYRLLGAPLEPGITCGHHTFGIGARGYHTFIEEPGMITCYASSDPNSKIQFEARPETEYYIREVVAPGFSEGAVTLTQVSKNNGLSELAYCAEQQD